MTTENKDRWDNIRKIYNELPETEQEKARNDFWDILQEEINKEIISQITSTQKDDNLEIDP